MTLNPENLKKPVTLFLTAFAVRLAYIFLTGPSAMLDMDSPEYLAYARNLLEGNGYTDGKWLAFRPPGYPFFIAGLYYVFGQSVLYLKIAQALISSLIPVLVYFTAKRLKLERIAFGAALFSCFYFGLYQEPAHILSEGIFTFLFFFSVYCLLKTEDNRLFFPLTGALLGLTTFTRPVGLLLVPLFLAWTAFRFYRENFLRHSLLLLLAFCAVLAPWWIRNYRAFGTFVPVCLETGFVMRHSHSDPERLKKLSEFDGLPELERDRKNFAAGMEYFKEHSAPRLLKRWTGNFLRFLYPFTPVYDFTYALIFPFWLYGLYAALKRRDPAAWPLFSMFVYFPVAAFFFGTARYRHSLGAFFILLAFLGVNSLLERSKDGKTRGKILFFSSFWLAFNLLVLFFSEQTRMFIKGFLI
ncbi:MAG: hypothetical protein COT17_01315 [Elusimicrobia bacterium CG08_land_8_20_14_0_20_51_18]|nr:MAG: hypothetical protein COT17_01315 [Elusimicrobia bacterium CG08_land_8_20_14_0_20_51_18]